MVATASASLFSDIDVGRLPPPAAYLFDDALEYVRLRPLPDKAVVERRRSPRFTLAADAAVRPLSNDGTPAGEPFRAVVVNLSTTGLRLINDKPVQADRMAVQIKLWATAVEAVITIYRTGRLGRAYEYAGPFACPFILRDAQDLANAPEVLGPG